MTKVYANPFARLGRCLFPWRRLFYGIPVFFLLLDNSQLYYPFSSHFYDEVFEIGALFIVFAGAGLRIWASGTTRRTVKKSGRAPDFNFCSKGPFSLVRNPHFLGDLIIVAGLSFTLMLAVPIIASISLFLLLSLPIQFERENLLMERHGAPYARYCEQTSLILPSFKNWKPHGPRFRWELAFQKESKIAAGIGFVFFFIEQLRELIIDRILDTNIFWMFFLVMVSLLSILSVASDSWVHEVPDSRNSVED